MLISFLIKFEKLIPSKTNAVNSLLLMQEFAMMTKSRKRSQSSKNKRQQIFEVSITKQSFQYERVEVKMTVVQKNIVTSKNTNAVHRID